MGDGGFVVMVVALVGGNFIKIDKVARALTTPMARKCIRNF